MKKIVSIVVAVALLAGCANGQIDKETAGTVIGGVVGGVVAKKLGGNAGAVVAGALLGGLIGNRLGAYLDEQDKKRVAELDQQALKTGTGGTFTANKSKAVIAITPASAPPTYEKPRDYGMAASPAPQPIVLVDPVTIRAYVDTPVYSSPDESGPPKLVIKKDVPMRISAKVANSDWNVVGDDNVGLGYVPKRYLESTIVASAKATPAGTKPKTRTTTTTTKTTTTTTTGAKTVAKAPAAAASTPTPLSEEDYQREMAAANAAYKARAAAGPAAAASAPATGKPTSDITVVQAASECKVVSRKVTPPSGGGDPFTENIKYCNEPPKGWQTQTV